jgi:hypothetical protein
MGADYVIENVGTIRKQAFPPHTRVGRYCITGEGRLPAPCPERLASGPAHSTLGIFSMLSQTL